MARRTRRTAAEMDALAAALVEIVAASQPMTVRQVFYQAVVRGLIAKTEDAYKRVVVRLLSQLRRSGDIPYDWIADNTRWVRALATYANPREAIDEVARLYRRDLWADNPVQLQVWCEKDALAGVLLDVTREWRVPLYVSRGFSSDSYLHAAAEEAKASGKTVIVYQLGDHDPSGEWISEHIKRGLAEHGARVKFRRIAVTEKQIVAMNLPTRPTKRAGNPHARDFEGDSVELDAIPPDDLRNLLTAAITRHVDQDHLKRLLKIEEQERASMRLYARAFRP